MQTDTHTQSQTCWCIYTFSHTAHCALRGMLLPPIRPPLSLLFAYTLTNTHTDSHTHTRTRRLFQCSSKGHLFRASEAEVACGSECKLPLLHTHSHTDTNTHTQTHTHSFLCQIPLLTVPPTTLNVKGREEKKI